MEENQVSNPQTVCPKCGKSVQSDFTRCPYCGAKLGTSSNNVKDFKEKAKSILQSIVKVAKAHKKATIGIVVALVVIIALIPIISAITSPFNSLKANSVSVGYQTAEEVEKQFGKPTDVLTDTSSSLPASCDEVWVYYPDSIDNQIKSINKMLENANSFADLDKADREYQKLTEKKYKQVVIGISDDKVVFYSLNTQAMYNEEDLFATKDSKQLSKCTFNKTMVCRDTTVSDNKITFTAKFSDGSIFMGKVSSYSQVDEKNPKVEFDCPWSKLSLTLNVVDHYFNSNCTCKNCGLEEHYLNNNCLCTRCNKTFHNINGCECENCHYNTHTPNEDCICTICNQLAHVLDNFCRCEQCGEVSHKKGIYESCTRCQNFGLRYEIVDENNASVIGHNGLFDSSVTIPDNYCGVPITKIENGAFNNSKITNITIPNSLKSIGEDAFWSCTYLTSITLPDSVTSIGLNAFHDTFWYNNQPDGLVYVGKIAYKYKGTMPSNTSIVIKDGTLGIANYAFSFSNLTSITIPNSVRSIGDGAFQHCNLTNITIPNGVTHLKSGVFTYCSNLTSITIPISMTEIDHWVFDECYRLDEIVFNGTKAQWNAIIKKEYWNIDSGSYTVYCTDGTISKYNS